MTPVLDSVQFHGIRHFPSFGDALQFFPFRAAYRSRGVLSCAFINQREDYKAFFQPHHLFVFFSQPLEKALQMATVVGKQKCERDCLGLTMSDWCGTMQPMTKRRKMLLRAVVSLVAITAAMSIWYVLANREHGTLNASDRTRMGGSYVSLSAGITRYSLTGPSDGKIVVLLHGASTGLWDFDLQVFPLEHAGFRVLRYDAFGRGFSDRPDVPYTRDLLRTQLDELLARLHLNGDVALVGHSLGGAIAVHFAAKNPRRVRALALISPVVNRVRARGPYIACNTPLLWRFLNRVAVIPTLRKRAAAQWKDAKLTASRYDRLFAQQASFDGFERASCSMFQTDLTADYRNDYAKIGAARIPSLLIWGRKDDTIAGETIDEARARLTGVHFVVWPDVGHSPHIEAASECNKALVSFLIGSL